MLTVIMTDMWKPIVSLRRLWARRSSQGSGGAGIVGSQGSSATTTEAQLLMLLRRLMASTYMSHCSLVL